MKRPFPWLIAGILFNASNICLGDELIDGIAAQVGEDIVLYSEVLDYVADVEKQMLDAGMPHSEVVKLRADGLERMIEEKMVSSEVRRMELFASDPEIDSTITLIAEENGISEDQLVESILAPALTRRLVEDEVELVLLVPV